MQVSSGQNVPFWKRGVPLWVIGAIVLGLVAIGSALLGYSYVSGTASLFRHVPVQTEELEYGSYPSLSNIDHFNTVKNRLITDGATFVEADLSGMVIRVYTEGKVSREFKILTKGREGSWWETPAGVYRIESKEDTHFSSFGHVYQPWSMAFQGNFFIHGWPHHPDGTPVSSQFSGGCIRLSDADAKAVYDLVSVGTPVIVFEQDYAGDAFAYEPRQADVSASSYLAADLRNNFVLAEHSSKEPVPIASLTKFVTALVAAEYINLDKPIGITSSMIEATTRPRLVPGSSVQAFQLLYPLLLESSNEAAEALARSVGLDRFVNLMNKKAEAIGMTNTHFVDPSGKKFENVSTAEDLFVLLKYVYNNRSFVLKMSTGELNTSAYGEPIYKDLTNYNDFGVTNAEFVGGKVGQTLAAGNTAIAVYNITIRGEKRPIAIVLLDSQDIGRDMREMVNYVLREY
ncbi:MAG TPA: L,D-transpeptidase family protein [Candidatus Paceibacterota bacterium]|jgi:D-alanyl-D-alanine carboxypeptidase